MVHKATVRFWCSILASASLGVTVACNGGNSGSDADSVEGPVQTSSVVAEPVILQAIYRDIRTPEGFYQEPTRDPATFYTIHHVTNTGIMAPSLVTDATPVYELCSDDFSEAYNWSEIASSSSGRSLDLADTTDTEMYFEFSRFNPEELNRIDLSRVFKCTYLDRSGVNLNDLSVFKGVLAKRPFDAYDLKLVVEYLWLFSYSNNFGHVVLSSDSTETADEYVHTLTEATLQVSHDPFGECDLIEVFVSTHVANKATGEIHTEIQPMTAFKSKLVEGVPQLCDESQ